MREVVVVGVAFDEQGVHVDAIGGEHGLLVANLGLRDAAVQMGADVLRFGRWGVVDVAADVEVVVVGLQLVGLDHPGKPADVLVFFVRSHDLLGVLRI
jgi:hypothetical protein